MPRVAVYNTEGKQVGEIDLKDEIFGAEVNQPLLHQAVQVYLANQRQGTHSAKTRAEVRGGGRNPGGKKAQAGQDTAASARRSGRRSGFAPNPGIIHKTAKMRRQAMLSATLKAANNEIMVLTAL